MIVRIKSDANWRLSRFNQIIKIGKVMNKKIQTMYDLTSNGELEAYKNNLKNISPDFTVKFNEKDFTFMGEYKGKELESTRLGSEATFDDTLCLKRTTAHKNILLTDLQAIGAICQIENKADLDVINFSLDPQINTMFIETIFDFGQDMELRGKALKNIENYPNIKILDDGKISDEEFAALKKEVEESEKQYNNEPQSIKLSAFQFGPVFVEIELEKPNTVGELISKVESLRSEILS